MKRFVLVLMTVVLAVPAFAADKLVGRWESTTRSQGGIGQTYEFREDGTMSVTPTAMVDGKYKVEKNVATILPPDGSSAAFEFSVDGATLTRRGNGQEAKLSRVGKGGSAENPLAATWTYEFRMGGPAYEIFETDGTFRFRYPMKATTPGHYTRKGEKLTIALQDGRKVTADVVWDGETLVLREAENRESRYVRAAY